jgi:DNA repair protein RecO (recombination protein O)
LFDIYAGTLAALGGGDELALRAFEVALLKEIGVLPDLSLVTLTQEALSAERRYSVLPEAGVGAPRHGDPALPGQVLIGLQAALEHGSLPALQQACLPALPELKALLRGLLHYHLGSPVLRTRQVMLDVQALDRYTTP